MYSPLILSLLGTLIALSLLRPLAVHIGLLDLPSTRKQHHGSIPLIGGLAIFSGIAIILITFQHITHNQLTYLFCSACIVLLGGIDDKYDVPANFRLAAQAGITLILCISSDLYISSFGNLLGLGSINLGWLSLPITLLAVIGAINAFNMLDGIDGLVGTSALISFGSLAILFFFGGQDKALILCLIFIAALLPYLANNLTIFPFKRKIFMGDAGSMLIGLTIVWLLILGSQRDVSTFRPVTALWIIAIPLMDMTSVMLRRMHQGHSPFRADRDHIHHRLMSNGFSPNKTLLIITIASLLLVSIGLVGEWLKMPDFLMFIGFLVLFLYYHYSIIRTQTSVKDRT